MKNKFFLIWAGVIVVGVMGLVLTQNRWLVDVDVWMIRNIYSLSGDKVVTGVMNWLTNYTIGSYVGLGVVGLYLLFRRQMRELWFFGGMGLVLYVFMYAIKNICLRMRPYEAVMGIRNLSSDVMMVDKYSFPSSHAAFSFFAAYLLAEVIWRKSVYRYWIYGLATVVAMSRLYLGVHYVSDVMVGTLVGLSFGVIIKWLIMRDDKKTKTYNTPL